MILSNPFSICRCKVLVVGGGAGGCAVAAKLSSKLGAGKVLILEPADVSDSIFIFVLLYRELYRSYT